VVLWGPVSIQGIENIICIYKPKRDIVDFIVKKVIPYLSMLSNNIDSNGGF